MAKYLIIKIGAIGDVIMALPMIEHIRKNDSDAHITWICGKTVYPILQCFNIDKIIVIDDMDLYQGNIMRKMKVVFSIWKGIAFRKYDRVMLGHADKLYGLLTIFTLKKIIKRFSHNIGKMCPVPGRHHTDEYVSMVYDKLLIERVKSAKLYLELDDGLKKCISSDKIKIILTPGGAKNAGSDDFCRRWPIGNYVKLAQELIKNGYEVIITGSKGDSWINEYFSGLPVINLIGKTSILSTISLFNNVEWVVTHDSGPMHMAGLTKCKIIAIFGPTNPYEKIPVRENVHVLWKPEDYACCPCYDGKYYAKCRDNICISAIDVDEVYDLIKFGCIRYE